MSRYARYIPDLQRRETWEETISRYVTFFDEKYPGLFPKEEVYDAINKLEVMPSMRALMTAGKALERDAAAGYNCAYIAVDDPRAFDETMYLLMCFEPNTMVKTKLGDKKISELVYTDEVLSFNTELNQFEYTCPSVIAETPSSHRDKIELEFEDGTFVRCTADHKFFTNNRGWVEAKDLTEVDEIKNYNEIG